jgi:hypothetical protein
MIIVFTLCSNNYLAQARTLGDSLLMYNPAYKFIIGLVDRKNPAIDYSKIPYEILEVENIGISNFTDLYRRYNIIELNTAVKPFFFKYLFNNEVNLSGVIYLDPDILVYSTFKDLEQELETSEIIITPHFTTPLNDDKIQSEEDFLNSGLYNLGFIAVKKSSEGSKMIDWWAERLFSKAFIDFKRGLFTDQIWINFVPLFFHNVRILNNQGYNVAYWNLHERKIKSQGKEYYINTSVPLVFFHFSGYNPLVPSILSKYQNRFSFIDIPDAEDLFKEYSAYLFLNGYNQYISFPSAYAGIREGIEKEKRKKEIQKIPFILRLFRIIVLKITAKHNLLLD